MTKFIKKIITFLIPNFFNWETLHLLLVHPWYGVCPAVKRDDGSRSPNRFCSPWKPSTVAHKVITRLKERKLKRLDKLILAPIRSNMHFEIPMLPRPKLSYGHMHALSLFSHPAENGAAWKRKCRLCEVLGVTINKLFAYI